MAKTILIVEDYPDTLNLLDMIFKKEGYEVDKATSGEQALDFIAKKKFDLVVLDVMLPRLDGFGVCRRIKLSENNKKTPVLIITAFDVPDIIDKCKSAGANEVILKPFDQEGLVNTVKKYIG